MSNWVGFFFQKDNAFVYQSKQVQYLLKENNISTVSWPTKGPDINITEDAWIIIPDLSLRLVKLSVDVRRQTVEMFQRG